MQIMFFQTWKSTYAEDKLDSQDHSLYLLADFLCFLLNKGEHLYWMCVSVMVAIIHVCITARACMHAHIYLFQQGSLPVFDFVDFRLATRTKIYPIKRAKT